MSGQGKYTTYAPPMSEKNTLLNKLFKSKDLVQRPPTQDLVGKETDAIAATIAIAKEVLTPTNQSGDLGHFPNGVKLDFSGTPLNEHAPDTAEGKDVKWTKAGDPANSFVPDVSSPGPGKTEGSDKDVDPEVAVKDLKPNYVQGAPGTGTKSPTSTSAKIIAANILGVKTPMGESGNGKS